MKTTSVPRIITVTPRPWVFRVAGKWYSWAGLLLTLVGAYLAFTGQVKIGDPGTLRAAPAQNGENDVVWKPSKGTWTVSTNPQKESAPQVAFVPFNPIDDGPSLPLNPTASNVTPQQLPEVIMAPEKVQATPNSKVQAVMESYNSGPQLQPTQFQAQSSNSGGVPSTNPSSQTTVLPPVQSQPMMALPPVPSQQVAVPMNPVPAPKEVPLQLPKADNTTPLNVNNAIAAQPTALQNPTKDKDEEMIPTRPTPVPKMDAMPKTPEPDNPEDAILLNAARNAVQLGNYPLAIDRFNQFIQRNPKLWQIREEFAGILITAKRLREATEQFAAILNTVKLEPRDELRIRVKLGDAYVIAKDYRQAIPQFSGALELAPERERLEIATRLARTFVFDSDFVRANQVFEKYLAQLRPEDPRAPRALGALLLDLERPSDAMPFLLKQREKDPNDVEILSSIVRGLARLGERQRALEIITEIATKDVRSNIGVLNVLGDLLFDMDEFELAGQIYNQVLNVDPVNGSALVGIARVHIQMFQPALARKVLDSFVPTREIQRGYLLTYASYHQTVGEYTEAKQIYRDILRRNELDHEVRYALAYLYDYVKEWEKAKAEYAKIVPPSAPPALVRRSRLGFANVLFHQRKFQESNEVLRILLAEDPSDFQAISTLTTNLAKSGHVDQAEQVARGYLATNPRSEYMALSVRLALAKALLDANKNLEAAREYEIALARPIGRIPAAYFGLARASERLGNAQRAGELLACVSTVQGGSIRNLLLLADLYSAEFEDHRVVELCVTALQTDPTNLAVLVRLADAQQRIARLTGRPMDCFDTCSKILSLSPTNVRGHLAMARSFAVAQNFRKSSVQYDQLISIDPEFTIPPRERARVLYSDHQYSAAKSQYDALQVPPADAQLVADIMGLIQKEPRLRLLLEPYTLGNLPGKVLRRELPRIQGTLGADTESQLAIQRIINDYDARTAEQTAFRLEDEAKSLKDLRPYMAIPAYDAINIYEPTNTETLFDAGQNFGRLRMTRRALEMYSSTLAVDPSHREALVATDRATANLAPRAATSFDFFYQNGRNGLANIYRYRTTTSASLPIGDENEFIQLGYSRVSYKPFDDRSLEGNIPFFRIQKKFDDNRLLLHGQVNVEQFEDRFSTRPTFDVGFDYDHSDCVHSRGGGYLDNVAENGESLRQDIFRGGVYGGLSFTPTRYLAFGGNYRYAHYSDNNNMNQFDLFSEISLTLPPKQLKVAFNFFYLGFSEGSIFPTNPPDPDFIFGTRHPYFAPRNFTYGEARIEWYHWLSRDYFVHSNQCWYSVQYGIGSDDNLETYHNVRGILAYEPCSWLTVGAEARGQFSSVYDMVSALAFIEVRFK